MQDRNTLLTYVDVAQKVTDATSVTGAEWALLGEGIEEGSISYNPETESKHYIHQKSGNTDIKSYAPTLQISQESIIDDDAYTFFDEKIRRPRATGNSAVTYIVNVEGTYNGQEVSGTTFPAELQKVSISIDEYGGSGTDGKSLGYTINYKGDAVWGTWDATTMTWSNETYAGV